MQLNALPSQQRVSVHGEKGLEQIFGGGGGEASAPRDRPACTHPAYCSCLC